MNTDHPECCGELMTIDGRLVRCEVCQHREELPDPPAYQDDITREQAEAEMLSVLNDPEEMDPDIAAEIKARPLRWVRLLTGWMAVYVTEGDISPGVSVPTCLWYLHGRYWTARHDPSQLALVGGSPPF